MECFIDEGSLMLEQTPVSSDVVEDVDNVSAKRIRTDVSNHMPTAAETTSTAVTAYSCGNNVHIQSVHTQHSLSDSAGTVMCSSDSAVAVVNGQSHLSTVDNCNDANVEHDALGSAADADISRRRHPRRKFLFNALEFT